MGYIYKITNKLNNKYYIGQTMGDLNKRWYSHKKISSNCIYLKRAFNKYGVDNFNFELICICFDNDLNKYEIEYMDKYNSIVPNGYNLRHGGNNGIRHQLTKDKISNSLKEYYTINESKSKGMKHTEETKQNWSKMRTGKKQIPTEKRKKQAKRQMRKVIQLDLNDNILNEYESCTEAATQNNVTIAGISMVCNNKRIQIKGFKYKYVIDDLDNLMKGLNIKKNN